MIYAENILICIGIPFLIILLFVRGNTQRFVASFIAGMAICLLAAYFAGFLNLVSGYGENNTAVYISPFIEEIMKLLPLLFLLYFFRPKDEMMVLLALGLGVGFATFENCCYLLTGDAGSLPFVVIRGMAVGVMHIVSILTLVLGLILVRRYRILSFPAIIGALSISTTFHALYNLLVSKPGLTSYLGYVLPLVTAVLLYVPYRRFLQG